MVGMEYNSKKDNKDTNLFFEETFFRGEVRSDFFVTGKMKRVWAAQMEIITQIDKICKKYDIQYFADSGTLLGAVRHHGFIPWDDDIDLAMKREDYNRFLEVARDELDFKYDIFIPFEDSDYSQMFAKVVNKTGLLECREDLSWNFDTDIIVGVDIFPLEYVPSTIEERSLYVRLYSLVSFAYMFIIEKRDNEKELNTSLKHIEKMGYKINKKGNLLKQLRSLIEELEVMYVNEETAKLFHSGEISLIEDYNNVYEGIFDVECYDDAILLEFENTKVPCPKGYDWVLKSLYGNYMELVKNQAMHEYPYYKSQLNNAEEAFKNKICKDIQKDLSSFFEVPLNDIKEIKVLKNTDANQVLSFEIGTDKCIFKVPKNDNAHFENFTIEEYMYNVLKPYQITEDCFYYNPDNGNKLSVFIDNTYEIKKDDFDLIADCLQVVRFIHELPVQVEKEIDVFAMIEHFEELWGDESYFEGYQQTKGILQERYEEIPENEKQIGLINFNLSTDNFLMFQTAEGQTDLRICSWQQAGMQDVYLDLAMFAAKEMYHKEELKKLVELYIGGEPDEKLLKKMYCYTGMCCLLLSNHFEYLDRKGIELRNDKEHYIDFAKDYAELIK